MSKPEICKSCSGTGLYSGMGERTGYAVVCLYCKGRGGSKGFNRISPGDVKKTFGGWGQPRFNAIHTVEISLDEFRKRY